MLLDEILFDLLLAVRDRDIDEDNDALADCDFDPVNETDKDHDTEEVFDSENVDDVVFV